jgi:hypothetical protein
VAKIQPYGCSSTKSNINTNPYLGSADISDDDHSNDNVVKDSLSVVKLYPNPNQGNFTIKIPNNLSFTYKIYNLQGQLLQTGFKTQTENITVNYPKGLYIVEVTVNNASSLHKLIIN